MLSLLRGQKMEENVGLVGNWRGVCRPILLETQTWLEGARWRTGQRVGTGKGNRVSQPLSLLFLFVLFRACLSTELTINALFLKALSIASLSLCYSQNFVSSFLFIYSFIFDSQNLSLCSCLYTPYLITNTKAWKSSTALPWMLRRYLFIFMQFFFLSFNC